MRCILGISARVRYNLGMKFSIRDVLWLTVVVALAVCWGLDRLQLWRAEVNARRAELTARQAAEQATVEAQRARNMADRAQAIAEMQRALPPPSSATP